MLVVVDKLITVASSLLLLVVINTMCGIWLQLCYTEKSRNNTSFVTGALAACSKVKGLPDCQLRQVDVLLVNIAGSPLRNELIKGVAIVCDAALHLQQAHAQQGVTPTLRPSSCRTQRCQQAQAHGQMRLGTDSRTRQLAANAGSPGLREIDKLQEVSSFDDVAWQCSLLR